MSSIPTVHCQVLSGQRPRSVREFRWEVPEKPALANATPSRGLIPSWRTVVAFFSSLCTHNCACSCSPRRQSQPQNAARPVNGRVTNHTHRCLASLISVFEPLSGPIGISKTSTATAFTMHPFAGFKHIDLNVSPGPSGPSGPVTEFGTCPQDSSRDDGIHMYQVRQAECVVESLPLHNFTVEHLQ